MPPIFSTIFWSTNFLSIFFQKNLKFFKQIGEFSKKSSNFQKYHQIFKKTSNFQKNRRIFKKIWKFSEVPNQIIIKLIPPAVWLSHKRNKDCATKVSRIFWNFFIAKKYRITQLFGHYWRILALFDEFYRFLMKFDEILKKIWRKKFGEISRILTNFDGFWWKLAKIDEIWKNWRNVAKNWWYLKRLMKFWRILANSWKLTKCGDFLMNFDDFWGKFSENLMNFERILMNFYISQFRFETKTVLHNQSLHTWSKPSSTSASTKLDCSNIFSWAAPCAVVSSVRCLSYFWWILLIFNECWRILANYVDFLVNFDDF